MTEAGTILDAQDLKHQIAAGEFRSLIDVILEGMGRSIQKLFRRTKPSAPWFSALVIALLIALIGLLVSLLSGGVTQDGSRTLFLGGVLTFLFFIIPRSVNRQTYSILQDHLLDKIDSNIGLSDLHNWLTALASRKWPILMGVLYVPVNIVYGILFLKDMDAPTEVVVIGLPLLFISGMMLYYLLFFVVLPSRLGRCHYKLNAFDPVSSEVVTQLSVLFNYIAYMIAFLLTAIALFAVSLVTFHISNLILIIPMWIVLIVIFATGQMSLSRIIKHSKRESLNQVEAQMTILREKGDLSDRETMEAIVRLWDYHDRLKNTRNSILDLNGVMGFINTLLIPLLGYLFANLSNILKLLGWME